MGFVSRHNRHHVLDLKEVVDWELVLERRRRNGDVEES
jgi:hypothetical protein